MIPVLSSKSPAFLLSLTVVLTSLIGCNNSPTAKNVQQSLAPDPLLQKTPNISNSSTANQPKSELPQNFPPEIPVYPQAALEKVISSQNPENSTLTRWRSSQPSNLISSFYNREFQTKNWVLEQPADNSSESQIFKARRNNLLVKVSIQPQPITNSKSDEMEAQTVLLIEYTDNTTTGINPPSDNSEVISAEFLDLDTAPPELKQHIKDLIALNIIPRQSQLFEPNKNITRREYARWLVTANNTIHVNEPAKQIRLGNPVAKNNTFTDVPPTDPDFDVIQGLADTGLIPSPLSGDSTAVVFRPDAPLTREQLILWKVPLDTRQALPPASLTAVNQTWGFQDTAKIDPKVLSAVLADFQNSEKSNIKRVFGYTIIFQPKKPVSRAEAAAALAYFGTHTEGISASEALSIKKP